LRLFQIDENCAHDRKFAELLLAFKTERAVDSFPAISLNESNMSTITELIDQNNFTKP